MEAESHGVFVINAVELRELRDGTGANPLVLQMKYAREEGSIKWCTARKVVDDRRRTPVEQIGVQCHRGTDFPARWRADESMGFPASVADETIGSSRHLGKGFSPTEIRDSR